MKRIYIYIFYLTSYFKLFPWTWGKISNPIYLFILGKLCLKEGMRIMVTSILKMCWNLLKIAFLQTKLLFGILISKDTRICEGLQGSQKGSFCFIRSQCMNCSLIHTTGEKGPGKRTIMLHPSCLFLPHFFSCISL